MHNFNFVDPLFDELLTEKLVFLVDIDDKNVAFLISSVELLLLIIPAQAGEDCLVWVAQLVMSGSFPLCSFEPLQCLVVTDSENQILLHDKEDLNYTNSVN